MTKRTSPSMTMPQCGCDARTLEGGAGGTGVGDLGEDVGHGAEERESDLQSILPDGSEVDGRDVHSDFPR